MFLKSFVFAIPKTKMNEQIANKYDHKIWEHSTKQIFYWHIIVVEIFYIWLQK